MIPDERPCKCGGTAHRETVDVDGKAFWKWSCDTCSATQTQPRPALDDARAALAAVPDRLNPPKRGPT